MPPCACSNFPRWRDAAPVNAPFSWPNSSDSISSEGTAAQLTLTNGRSRRALRSWIARATSSLPVPVSPRMHTRDSVGATRSTCAMTRCIASLVHTSSWRPTRRRSCRFSSSSRASRSVFSTVSSSLSDEIGFSRKSDAPSRVARTAMSTVACPEIMMIGVATPSSRSSASMARPSFPGITTSEKTMSKRSCWRRAIARAA